MKYSVKYIKHAEKATELLKQPQAIHNAEMAGTIPAEEATKIAIALNLEAISESEKAIQAYSDEEA